MTGRGGARPGAGRKKGSLNKSTLARMSAAEVLGVDDTDLLEQAIHRRGHGLLLEMERLALDPTQSAGVRILAARTALPFLLPRPEPEAIGSSFGPDLIAELARGRERVSDNRGRLVQA